MKSSTYLLALLIIISISNSVYSQEFKVPKNFKLETQDDYKKYENDILAYVEYLENSPVNELNAAKKEANAFFIKWITGAPNVMVSVREYSADFFRENKEFLLIYMAGWTKYSIESGDKDEVKGSIAGFKSIIKVYKLGKGVAEDGEVEDLIEMDEEGELEQWVKEQIAEEI